MTSFRRFVSPALALVGLISLPGIASAALVATQPPCIKNLDFCLQFAADEDIPIVRGFSFNAPGKGTALVNFQGTLECFANDQLPRQVQINSQIVTVPNLLADRKGPGSLALDRRFANITTFNLASKRVFQIAGAGKQTYYFKLRKIFLTQGTYCRVYSASFAVLFTPTSP